MSQVKTIYKPLTEMIEVKLELGKVTHSRVPLTLYAVSVILPGCSVADNTGIICPIVCPVYIVTGNQGGFRSIIPLSLIHESKWLIDTTPSTKLTQFNFTNMWIDKSIVKGPGHIWVWIKWDWKSIRSQMCTRLGDTSSSFTWHVMDNDW